MIEQEFKNVLDSKTLNKVYLNHALETAQTPYAVVNKISAPRGYTLEGRDGTVISRFQLNVFDKDYKTAKEYASQFYSVGDYTGGNISNVRLDNEQDNFDGTANVHMIILDFIVNHYE